MEEKYIVTLYQKIQLNENVIVFRRIGTIDNVQIDSNDEFQEITYYDNEGKRVIVECMTNPYTFVSDDIYCYGFPVTLSTLKEIYPQKKDIIDLKETYIKDMSEVISFAYYDRENDSVKILATNEITLNEVGTDILFTNFNVVYDSINNSEEITYPLKDFRKMVKLAQTGRYDILKEELLRINDSIDEMEDMIIIPNKKQEVNHIEEENIKIKNIDESLEKLNQLVGLDNIKLEINKLLKYLIYINKVKDKTNLSNPNLHMFFTGNPGTGKTTVARIIGSILYNMGYIKKDKVTEITPERLIAGYVGQTAIKTRELLDKNRGGVIFIDEAYILAGKAQQFAGEALTEILKELEKNETVFIFAGYVDEMKEFMEMNPGLTSRIGYYLDYKDYTKEELYQIFEYKLNSIGLKVNDGLKEIIINHLNEITDTKNFGNGRYIDKLVNKLLLEHATNTETITDETSLLTLTENDWKEEVKDTLVFKTKTKSIGFKS